MENIENANLELTSFLDGSEFVDFDEELAKVTLENQENNWLEKMTDGIGGVE